MKAKVKLALPGFAGNMDDMVIYYNSKLNKLITKRKGKLVMYPITILPKKFMLLPVGLTCLLITKRIVTSISMRTIPKIDEKEKQ